MQCVRLPRGPHTEEELQKVLAKVGKESPSQNDIIKLTGSRCKEYLHVFEEVSPR